jgi:DNA gyrase subunit B
MYIGDVGQFGLHHLLYEVIDNALAEARRGFATRLRVELLPEHSCRVEDNGRGLPINRLPSPAELCVLPPAVWRYEEPRNPNRLRSGLHGLGLPAVAALSRVLLVEAQREGRLWRQEYERGQPVGETECVGDAAGTGTTLTFWPDPEIFEEGIRFDYGAISNRCRELACFSPGVVIQVLDRQAEPVLNETFHAPEGALDLLRHFNRSRSQIQAEVLRIQTREPTHQLDLAFQWTRAEGEQIWSYANGCPSRSGTHVTGFRGGLTRTLNRFLLRTKLANEALPTEPLREGLTAVVFLDLPEPRWTCQTKERLINPEAESLVAAATRQVLEQFFERSPDEARALGEYLVRLAAQQRGRRLDPKVGRV